MALKTDINGSRTDVISSMSDVKGRVSMYGGTDK